MLAWGLDLDWSGGSDVGHAVRVSWLLEMRETGLGWEGEGLVCCWYLLVFGGLHVGFYYLFGCVDGVCAFVIS